MTPAELALLNQFDRDRADKGLRGKEKMRYVGMSHDKEGSDRHLNGIKTNPPRNKRKLRKEGQ